MFEAEAAPPHLGPLIPGEEASQKPTRGGNKGHQPKLAPARQKKSASVDRQGRRRQLMAFHDLQGPLQFLKDGKNGNSSYQRASGPSLEEESSLFKTDVGWSKGGGGRQDRRRRRRKRLALKLQFPSSSSSSSSRDVRGSNEEGDISISIPYLRKMGMGGDGMQIRGGSPPPPFSFPPSLLLLLRLPTYRVSVTFVCAPLQHVCTGSEREKESPDIRTVDTLSSSLSPSAAPPPVATREWS